MSAQAPAAVPTASPSLMRCEDRAARVLCSSSRLIHSSQFRSARREKLAGKKVVLTREAGKNEQLQTRLEEFGIEARTGCRIMAEDNYPARSPTSV